ncbi:hypothetical protein BDC45DRAFT_535696 [Circinella umbellata]|nr:hypothetical protein BDC45DRAFT_535696 [Circinella umbellata]
MKDVEFIWIIYSEFILLNSDEVIDSFVNPLESIVSYAAVKQLVISKFTETMKKKKIQDYILNKRDVNWNSLANSINRSKEREKITKNVEEMRQDIVAATNDHRMFDHFQESILEFHPLILELDRENIFLIPQKS